MRYTRMPIEAESPEQLGYDTIECNLAESSVTDALLGEIRLDLQGLVLGYGHHSGSMALRELISAEEKSLKAEDVLLTNGAAGALFIVATSLLEKEDHLIVVRPNYATNIETPRAIGCDISFIDLEFEEGFRLDIERIRTLVKPSTKLISITNPHNPTGTLLDEKDLHALIAIAEKNGIRLLVDETYRDLSFKTKLPLGASLSSAVISVSSVSKAMGLPGIRLGWLITTDRGLQELFLAAKEQIWVCNSVVDEEIAFRFLKEKERFFPPIRMRCEDNFQILEKWMSDQSYLEWIKPAGGVVCFPRFKNDLRIDTNGFYQRLYRDHKTLVGPGHWFEQSDRFLRIGYGWPGPEMLKKGLENILLAARDSIS